MFHMRCSPVLAFKGQLCNVVVGYLIRTVSVLL